MTTPTSHPPYAAALIAAALLKGPGGDEPSRMSSPAASHHLRQKDHNRSRSSSSDLHGTKAVTPEASRPEVRAVTSGLSRRLLRGQVHQRERLRVVHGERHAL